MAVIKKTYKCNHFLLNDTDWTAHLFRSSFLHGNIFYLRHLKTEYYVCRIKTPQNNDRYMRIMTRMGDDVLKHINGEWVKCLHTLGAPLQEGDAVLAPERH